MPTVRFNPELKCKAKPLSYDPKTRVGRLDIVAGGCADMSGCIAAFERIDGRVQRIETYSGWEPDTVYLRRGRKWVASEHELCRSCEHGSIVPC